MTAPVFVDTNIFVYARGANDPLRQSLAQELLSQLWRDRNGRISMQVLSEFFANVTRQPRPGLDPALAWGDVEALLCWSPQPLDRAVLVRARQLQMAHTVSWWDALIVSAAEAQNCAVLLTEDLQDGGVYGRVTVRNPFKTGVQETLATYGADLPAPVSRHRRPGRPPGKRRAA